MKTRIIPLSFLIAVCLITSACSLSPAPSSPATATVQLKPISTPTLLPTETTTPTTTLSPTPTGPNELIVAANSGQLLLVSLDNQSITHIDFLSYYGFAKSMSPDGIRFIVNDYMTTARITLIDTGESIPLPFAIGEFGKWSLDGKTIIAESNNVPSDGKLYFLDPITGKEISQMTAPVGDFSFTPDGKVVLNHYNSILTYNLVHDPSGRILSFDTSDPLQTLKPDVGERSIDELYVSPRGDQIAFLASPYYGSTDHSAAVFLMNMDGSNLLNLTAGISSNGESYAFENAVWSPDNRHLALTAFLVQPGSWVNPRVYVVDVAGNPPYAIQEITDETHPHGNFPDWSSDGSRLLFTGISTENNSQIILCAPDGSGKTPVPGLGGVDWAMFRPYSRSAIP